MNKKRGLRRSQLIATGIAGLLSITFLITLVAPPGTTPQTVNTPQNSSANNNNPANFDPVPAAENFTSTTPYVHPSGLFQSYRPAAQAYRQLSNSANPAQSERGQVVEVRFQGNNNCAVIHLLTEVGAGYGSIDDLAEAMDEAHFTDAWGQYGAWEERSRDVDENQIVTEFDLRQPASSNATCPDSYRGRVVSWLSNDIAHHVRMVVRNDDTASLAQLEQALIPAMITYPHNIDALGRNWRAQIDTDKGFFFLTPNGWTLDNTQSTAERSVYTGQLTGTDFTVAVERIDDTTFENADDAEAWLANFIPSNATIMSAGTVQQPYASGYQISYGFTNSEGLQTSAVATLLNDADGVLYFSDLRGAGIDADLLSFDSDALDNPATAEDAIDLAQTFTVMLASL